MINIDYSNGIRITTGNLNGLFSKDELPLKIQVKKVISKEIVWESYIDSNMWASYPTNEIFDVVILDNKNNFITQYYWNLHDHGSIFYKSLWFYCKGLVNRGIKPKGLVIGTHDGEFGEWVPIYRNYMSDMVLVEGSYNQYKKLEENYQGKDGIKTLFELVTPTGEDVEFFEGGLGYTNTVVERVIRYWEKEEVMSSKRSSISINNLIEREFDRKVDWLHLDVEGLDGKLLLSMNENYLPNFIIYEDFNLDETEKKVLISLFENMNYTHHSNDGKTMVCKQ